MKKRKGFCLRMFVMAFCCMAAPGYAQFFPVDTAKLNTAYRELAGNPNTPARQKAFFDAFPSTWREFIMTYQYVPDKNYDLAMYDLAYEHIEKGLGGRITLIADSIYCDKLINLSIGGQWDADAPNYLQSVLKKTIWKKMEMMFDRLSKWEIGYQFKFWQFYWASLHKKDSVLTDFKRLKKLMEDRNPNEVKVMEEAFHYSYGQSFVYENYPHSYRSGYGNTK